MTKDNDGGDVARPTTSRRDFLRMAGMAGAAALAAPVLAACGSSGSKSSSTTAAGATGTSAAAAGGAATSAELNKIIDYLGTSYDPKYSGAGMTWKIGSVLPFTGNGSFFGGLWSTGIDLAVQHIQAIGGPHIVFAQADNGSGDATKSHQAVQQMVADNVPGLIATEALGGVFGPLNQYHMLALDSGAGAPEGIQGIPYFYGARSAYYTDQWEGTLKYMQAKMPDKKNVVTVGNVVTIVNFDKLLRPLMEQYGFKLAKTVNATAGATDYASVIAEVQASNPDIVWPWISQFDIGYFMKQYKTSGMTAPVFTFQWTRAARQIAGSGYDGVYFSTEFLDWADPASDWQKLYIQDYTAKHGYPPEAYTADFYTNVFMWWQLMRDVLAKGGNINSGPALLAALESNPVFPTVFGGSGSTIGQLTMDLKTHSPSTLPQAVFVDHGGSLNNPTLTQVATYNVGGGSFQLT
jgi:ABC-type branched-subunit amino acid transport system substrate-binding protein